MGGLWQRYQTPKTVQRPPEGDHQTSPEQLPATVPPQHALASCNQRTSISQHHQILAIRRTVVYPWEHHPEAQKVPRLHANHGQPLSWHHQRPPQPTIWIEWRQDPPCGEASVGVKVWASYAYLEGGVQQLTQSTATLGAAPTADSMPQFRTIPAQISMMSGAQELATWFGFGLNQMAPQQLH